MIQEILVYIIVAAALVYAGISVYRLTIRRNDPCNGCAGCDLKRELEHKTRKGGECPDRKPTENGR